MKYFILFSFLIILATACKQKKETVDKKPFFPVLSFIKSQVAHVDTSLYSIKKIIYIDSTRSDTVYIPREEFRSIAKDFLEIPDLEEKKYRSRFQEESMFDETMNRVILTYQPLNREKEEIQSQQVLIMPNQGTGDKVMSIIIDLINSNRDGSVQKNMLWQVDQYFQVTTTQQKPGQPETTTIMKVTWNEQPEE